MFIHLDQILVDLSNLVHRILREINHICNNVKGKMQTRIILTFLSLLFFPGDRKRDRENDAQRDELRGGRRRSRREREIKTDRRTEPVTEKEIASETERKRERTAALTMLSRNGIHDSII